MSLPIVVLPNNEKWDCHQCGVCCRGSVIPLSDEDLARLRSQHWDKHPDYQNIRTVVRMGWSRRTRLAHRRDGSCVFLTENGQCRIHSEHGMEAKPNICRVFPLQLVPGNKQAALTVRRACPSAALDRGQAIQRHVPFIQSLVREGRLSTKPIDPPAFKANDHRDWRTIETLLDLAAGLLQDDRFPPVRRIAHLLRFAGLLESAKTKAFSDEKLLELAGTLAELAPEESREFFQDRQSPSWYGRILFRQISLEYARLHAGIRKELTWKERIRLSTTGWVVFRGRSLPRLGAPFASADFDDLEKPFDRMDMAVDRVLARHIETLSASHLYAMADRQGWSILDSMRGLAMLYPVGLWLLRWVAHGREPTVDDIVNIVVALDRGQGFGPLTGTLHKRRLSTLGTQSDLERLVVWYA
ncbi:MAG: YkgJ family cysteine cluster protein [Pirellula sp.]